MENGLEKKTKKNEQRNNVSGSGSVKCDREPNVQQKFPEVVIFFFKLQVGGGETVCFRIDKTSDWTSASGRV